MKDRIPTPAKAGRVLITPENGGAPYYATITMADEPLEEGTALVKANLLTDRTAAKFGFDTDAVPEDAFSFLGTYAQHWWKRRRNVEGENVGLWEFLQANDRAAYPDNGIYNGYEYAYLGIPFDNVVLTPKIFVGSYTGTGAHGPENPNSFTFNTEPVVVLIKEKNGQGMGLFLVPALDQSFGAYGYGSLDLPASNEDFAAYSNKTLTWYNVRDESPLAVRHQLNTAGSTYFVAAICAGETGVDS